MDVSVFQTFLQRRGVFRPRWNDEWLVWRRSLFSTVLFAFCPPPRCHLLFFLVRRVSVSLTEWCVVYTRPPRRDGVVVYWTVAGINVLQEEAENERMHLLIFMQVCQPSAFERGLVVLAQGLYLSFYSVLYLTHSRAAHRLTGYLEEEAHRAYTDYLASIDGGKIKNRAAPEIARTYYNLGADATMRDVILHVRADEAMHRDTNHHFGNKYGDGDMDSEPWVN